jgi:prepilin-type N-terminal cleavage/methylation domain-containing protein
MYSRPTDRSGFTLVELLVVVSVIALLIAMLMPSLKQARQQAKQVVCASHLKSIAGGIWNYQSDASGRVPYVQTPMTNGSVRPGFGNPYWRDDQIDPFRREDWPMSLANTLMPTYLGQEEGIFVCPGALVGWPRSGGLFRFTYRPAGANQPNGLVDNNSTYFREHFAFLDGRIFKEPPPYKMTGVDPQSIVRDAQGMAAMRGTYVRDMVKRINERKVLGPHHGGNNVVNKRLEVEYRNEATVNEDLAYESAVRF